jgi:hypothetical protein
MQFRPFFEITKIFENAHLRLIGDRTCIFAIPLHKTENFLVNVLSQMLYLVNERYK